MYYSFYHTLGQVLYPICEIWLSKADGFDYSSRLVEGLGVAYDGLDTLQL